MGVRPTLDDDYDAPTLRRIDRAASGAATRTGPEVATGWRGRTAAGVLAAGLVLGMQEVFAPSEGDPVIEEVDVSGLDADVAVRVALVPPAASGHSRAWVRPWLLA